MRMKTSAKLYIQKQQETHKHKRECLSIDVCSVVIWYLQIKDKEPT